MSTAKVTVGIPTFNRSAWLGETIESVLAQTFTSFRLIVADNASEDETPVVVRSFDDERIEYVRSERNIGQIANFNRLIALADTELLVLLPDDDLLYPGHLEASVEALERFETAGLVHSAFDVIDARSRVVQRIDPLRSRSRVMLERRDLALERMMITGWPIDFSSVVYRTKAIVEADGLRDEEEPWGDLQMWMRIALRWDFGYVARPLSAFRIHQESTTSDIGVEHGVMLEGRELALLHARIRFQRRTSFIDDAPLDPERKAWLRALATLERARERTGAGLPWREVVAEMAKLVWASPRITLRPELWRLVLRPEVWRRLLGGLGARRVRSILREARGHGLWQH